MSSLLCFLLVFVLLVFGFGLRLNTLKALAVLWLISGIWTLYVSIMLLIWCLTFLTLLIFLLMGISCIQRKKQRYFRHEDACK